MPVPELSGLDRTMLNPIVRTALENNTVEVVGWQVIPILQGRASPAGVYRVTGRAQEQGRTIPWSLVVKVYQSAEMAAYGGNKASDDPAEAWYWKREMLVYQSGLFDNLPDGFAAPRCYQVDDLPHEGRIWMEDVREDVGAIWPLGQYGRAARHYGRFNGIYLTKEAVPTWPWLLHNVTQERAEGSEWPEFWQNYPTLRHESALVRRGWSDNLAYDVNRLWEDREQFFQALAQLPQTLLQHDAGRKNLFARQRANGELETVAVDWGLLGTGAIGEELATFVSQPVYWFNGVLPEQLPELDRIAFDGYVQGLRDVGWQGDPALARLGFTASVALRAGVGIFIMEWTARDEGLRTWIESAMGHPIEELVDTLRGVRRYVVDCAEEARQLMASQAVRTQAK
jgi:hypothetical protein